MKGYEPIVPAPSRVGWRKIDPRAILTCMKGAGGEVREKRCALIQAVVTPTMAAWVAEQARLQDRSVSDYLRRLVEEQMQRSEAFACIGE